MIQNITSNLEQQKQDIKESFEALLEMFRETIQANSTRTSKPNTDEIDKKINRLVQEKPYEAFEDGSFIHRDDFDF